MKVQVSKRSPEALAAFYKANAAKTEKLLNQTAASRQQAPLFEKSIFMLDEDAEGTVQELLIPTPSEEDLLKEIEADILQTVEDEHEFSLNELIDEVQQKQEPVQFSIEGLDNQADFEEEEQVKALNIDFDNLRDNKELLESYFTEHAFIL